MVGNGYATTIARLRENRDRHSRWKDQHWLKIPAPSATAQWLQPSHNFFGRRSYAGGDAGILGASDQFLLLPQIVPIPIW